MQIGQLKALGVAHDAFIDAWKGSGGRTLAFNTPCCGAEVTAPAPEKRGPTWDSLTTCQHCGGLFMKVVTFDSARGFIPPELGSR